MTLLLNATVLLPAPTNDIIVSLLKSKWWWKVNKLTRRTLNESTSLDDFAVTK